MDEQIEITPNFVDVERIFTNKAPRLARWIPNFVFNYLRRVIHEPDVNEFLYAHRNDTALEFATATIHERFSPILTHEGIENVPLTGKCLIAANHPLGALDGVALMDVIGHLREDIKFPVNDLLMNFPPLRPFFIPINKHGSNKENMMLFNQTFEQDNAILYFPAGLVSRRQKGGIIEDLEWKKTFILKCIETKRDVIPTYFKARNSSFFYNLAYWRKKLGINANIEMLYLADEMFRQNGKSIHIIFGKPIPYQTFDKSRTPSEWAELVKRHVYNLEKNPQAIFNP